MKVSVILAHPDGKSFNHAIAEATVSALSENGHQSFYHDLYQEKFPPLLTAGELARNARLSPIISRHCAEIGEAEGIVIVHPNWWGGPPAILKGWVDRVIRPGVAYEFNEGDSGEGVPNGLLKMKTALVFNTTNTFTERELATFGDPLETIWKNCVFGLCGVHDFHRRSFGVIVQQPQTKAIVARRIQSHNTRLLSCENARLRTPTRRSRLIKLARGACQHAPL
jgi:NAD(P)H dehydrogenase (quinone)